MNKLISTFLCCFFALVLQPAVGYPAAGDDAGLFRVRCVYLDSATRSWRTETVWKFVPGASGRVDVFRSDETTPGVTLTYSATGRLKRIEDRLTGMYTRDVGADEPIVYSWGFPLAFDDLNPGNPNLSSVTIHRRVGDTRFAYDATREIVAITQADAAAQGMIDEANRAALTPSTVLKLIVLRSGQTLRVRQLWAEGDGWWLYEETESRRSWRIVE